MEQYEKNGPPPDPEKQYTRVEIDQRIQRLQDLCDKQSRLIDELKTELRRIKAKMDSHASAINQMRKNG